LRHRAAGQRLTAVQQEYLRLLCAGKSNPEIARIRNRSVNTVRNQIVPLFEIFGVQSRSELVAECMRSGVLEEPFRRFTAS
jgi:DNA-binding CsgD family transcriptional regulator